MNEETKHSEIIIVGILFSNCTLKRTALMLQFWGFEVISIKQPKHLSVSRWRLTSTQAYELQTIISVILWS